MLNSKTLDTAFEQVHSKIANNLPAIESPAKAAESLDWPRWVGNLIAQINDRVRSTNRLAVGIRNWRQCRLAQWEKFDWDFFMARFNKKFHKVYGLTLQDKDQIEFIDGTITVGEISKEQFHRLQLYRGLNAEDSQRCLDLAVAATKIHQIRRLVESGDIGL